MEVDMHIHTIASDGTFTPEEIVKRAKSLGMKSIAITDHDTIDGSEEGKRTAANWHRIYTRNRDIM